MVEELTRCQRGLELHGAVEERRLLADPDRRRLTQGRDGDDLDPRLGRERIDGGTQCALAVAEIRTQSDEGARHGLVTVTPTVPSRPAGRTSGFRTRTRIRSGEKRRSSSSATADARASSSAYCRSSETSCTVRATST